MCGLSYPLFGQPRFKTICHVLCEGICKFRHQGTLHTAASCHHKAKGAACTSASCAACKRCAWRRNARHLTHVSGAALLYQIPSRIVSAGCGTDSLLCWPRVIVAHNEKAARLLKQSLHHRYTWYCICACTCVPKLEWWVSPSLCMYLSNPRSAHAKWYHQGS